MRNFIALASRGRASITSGLSVCLSLSLSLCLSASLPLCLSASLPLLPAPRAATPHFLLPSRSRTRSPSQDPTLTHALGFRRRLDLLQGARCLTLFRHALLGCWVALLLCTVALHCCSALLLCAVALHCCSALLLCTVALHCCSASHSIKEAR